MDFLPNHPKLMPPTNIDKVAVKCYVLTRWNISKDGSLTFWSSAQGFNAPFVILDQKHAMLEKPI